MILAFSYKQIGKRFLPIISVKIGKESKFIETEAYVDSGASISAFHTTIAELLNIDYKKGEIVYPKGTAGHIKAYKIKAKLQIEKTEINCNVLFSNELTTKFNLLGLEGVFDTFKILFDNKNKKIILEKY